MSLTSIICKVLETFIRNIYNHLTANNLLSPQQYGFCEGRSTVTQLLATINDWMTSLDAKTPVDAVYLDFSKAFDSVPHSYYISSVSMVLGVSYLSGLRISLLNAPNLY